MDGRGATAPATAAEPTPDDVLLPALRCGEEAAFAELVERYQRPLVRLALLYVPTREVAEEVVQETWIGVIRGVASFEGRASLRTWISRIVTYQARSRGERERRSVPLSQLAGDGEAAPDADEVARGGDRTDGSAGWAAPADERVLGRETQAVVARTVDRLPPAQRAVISLRDVQGWTSDEVCAALAISRGNQRVLLHRARSKVRAALQRYEAATA